MTMTLAVGIFPAGDLVFTPEVRAKVPFEEILEALLRHLSGDWGVLDEHDWKMNDAALLNGCCLLSRYATPAGVKFCILTELDRSVTTVRLANDH
jgi:hypothetical protein